jgi:hypothetical protein
LVSRHRDIYGFETNERLVGVDLYYQRRLDDVSVAASDRYPAEMLTLVDR